MKDLEIELRRTYINVPTPTGIGTFGELHIKHSGYFGVPSYYTLEDEVRDFEKDISEVKVKRRTAIPMGVYELVVTKSQRFKKFLPLIKNVEGFEGIRIHSGATTEHTEGCPLIGVGIVYDAQNVPVRLSGGRDAEKEFLDILGKKKRQIWIPNYDKIYITVIISSDAVWFNN